MVLEAGLTVTDGSDVPALTLTVAEAAADVLSRKFFRDRVKESVPVAR
jgi:hypothetical protein